MHIALLILLTVNLFVLVIVCVILGWPYINNFINSKFRKAKYEKLGKSSQIRLINQLRESVEYFSKHKIGSLITIENADNLDNLRTDGVILNANISSALLIAIFNKNSPLHDGAVVIRQNKIYYAATFYKITKRSIENNYGSRHRAALGISEQSDATTIVVSEETGSVKIIKGNGIHNIKIEEFQEQLIKYLQEN
ncbi:diadenylate cyclase [Mycoplasmopsis gallopavonis]|uniref:Membrane protein n=1 Tax=Mycoplasmopsis gallopavonis TaxID=76629 RepID=A0A449B069_9BACT|nr:DNA integrity scanning protein DisA nucleotide-binding domain protein [Mycoplasmopsis gallopavonis]RIV16849.1 diadenylate cyclase [Mycoplasmopsis gallopavonis]VEU73153.1 membrane protein [Mycoplasmopsis gallopavonis]